MAGLPLADIDSYLSGKSPLKINKNVRKLYTILHHYIITYHKQYSKSDIGNLYKEIDTEHLNNRPDNVYRKIEKIF